MPSYQKGIHDTPLLLTHPHHEAIALSRFITLIKRDQVGSKTLTTPESLFLAGGYIRVNVSDPDTGPLTLSIWTSITKYKSFTLSKRGNYPISKSVLNKIEVWYHVHFKTLYDEAMDLIQKEIRGLRVKDYFKNPPKGIDKVFNWLGIPFLKLFVKDHEQWSYRYCYQSLFCLDFKVRRHLQKSDVIKVKIKYPPHCSYIATPGTGLGKLWCQAIQPSVVTLDWDEDAQYVIYELIQSYVHKDI